MGFTGVITTPKLPCWKKMIFQLVGRFFLGAKFCWTQKNKPLPFAWWPSTPGVPQRKAKRLSQNVPLHAKASPSNSEYLGDFFPTEVESSQLNRCDDLGSFKNKKNNGCIEWTKNTKRFRISFPFASWICLFGGRFKKKFHLNGGWVENVDESMVESESVKTITVKKNKKIQNTPED